MLYKIESKYFIKHLKFSTFITLKTKIYISRDIFLFFKAFNHITNKFEVFLYSFC